MNRYTVECADGSGRPINLFINANDEKGVRAEVAKRDLFLVEIHDVRAIAGKGVPKNKSLDECWRVENLKANTEIVGCLPFVACALILIGLLCIKDKDGAITAVLLTFAIMVFGLTVLLRIKDRLKVIHFELVEINYRAYVDSAEKKRKDETEN